MTQPLALVLYEKLLPGSQLVNRLQDMNYRVESISDPALLGQCSEQTKPLLIIADLESAKNSVMSALSGVKQNPATKHLPIIGFCKEDSAQLRADSEKAGITLLVTEAAIMNHLPQLLQQALELE